MRSVVPSVKGAGGACLGRILARPAASILTLNLLAVGQGGRQAGADHLSGRGCDAQRRLFLGDGADRGDRLCCEVCAGRLLLLHRAQGDIANPLIHVSLAYPIVAAGCLQRELELALKAIGLVLLVHDADCAVAHDNRPAILEQREEIRALGATVPGQHQVLAEIRIQPFAFILAAASCLRLLPLAPQPLLGSLGDLPRPLVQTGRLHRVSDIRATAFFPKPANHQAVVRPALELPAVIMLQLPIDPLPDVKIIP